MNRDILPPRKQPTPEEKNAFQEPGLSTTSSDSITFEDIDIVSGGSDTEMRPRKKGKMVAVIFLIFLSTVLLTGVLGLYWYKHQLTAVNAGSAQKVRFEILPNTSVKTISIDLEREQLIRSARAFEIFVRLNSNADRIQSGKYTLSKSLSVPEIANHLTSGTIDTFRITFYPGATLRDTTDKPENQKTDVVSMLQRAGYDDNTINDALAASYDHPLLASRPKNADLEGYVYGETYEFTSNATVEEVLERTFDQMYATVNDLSLVKAYKKRGLSLYEAITLASIVTREVPNSQDQKLVAGVFLNRLKQGIMLGSDVTYQYIADKTGQPRSIDIDSKYNTRRYTGLPPGPISAPSESALLAVANPTKSNYLYFLSGDDDKTYFATTEAEHNENIQKYCQLKCKII